MNAKHKQSRTIGCSDLKLNQWVVSAPWICNRMCLGCSDLDERVCRVIAVSYSSNILKNTCRNFCLQTACLFRNLLRKKGNCLDWRKAFVPAEGSDIAVICKLKDMFHTIPFCSILMFTAAYTLNNSVEQNQWWAGIFAQLFKKLSPFHVTRVFVTVFQKASIGPCPETYYSNPHYLIVSVRSVLILSHVGADFQNVSDLKCFISNPCIVSHACYMLCPFHYFVFDDLNKRFVKFTDDEAPLYVIISIILLL
jgi:hypothetical protein